MRAFLSQTFVIDAAHSLVRSVALPEYAASARIHGHTYTVEVTVAGELRDGMIALPKRPGFKPSALDIDMLRRVLLGVRERLDHRLLDDVPGLGRPTMENLCVFIGDAIRAQHLPVVSVRVSRQTGDSARVDW